MTDVVLDDERALVVQPDLMFVSNERAAIVSDRVHGAPDLALEVLSPRPRVGKLHEHIDWFASYGVRECWLVDLVAGQYAILRLDQRKGVTDRRLFAGGEPAPSIVLPGVIVPPIAL